MIRVFVADAQAEERSALRLTLIDLNMGVVGEASCWQATLAEASRTLVDILLVDYDLLPAGSESALAKLHSVFPGAIVLLLINPLDARHQATLSRGADAIISKGETPERVAERLRAAANTIGQ